MARRRTSGVDLPHASEMELPDGRLLSEGAMFTPHGGGGKFRFRYQYLRDGSVTAYGPITSNGSPNAQVRSFRPEQIKTIHRNNSNINADRESVAL